MKKIIGIIIWIIVIIVLTIVIILSNKPIKTICCNIDTKNTCFDIEIADDNESRQLWLMYRESLPEYSWMLFVYTQPWAYSFRMKNTLIPLAGIWLDENLKIVDIIQMDPCKTEQCPSYKPNSKAQYILEINQRLISEKWLLSVWDTCHLILSKNGITKNNFIRKLIWNFNVIKSKF